MKFHLTVVSPFNGHSVGDQIVDADKVEEAMASHPSFVTRVIAPEAPEAPEAPAPVAEEAAAEPAPQADAHNE